MIEVPKAIRNTGAALACVGALAAAEQSNSGLAHGEAAPEASLSIETGGFEEQLEDYQQELQEYCGKLAVVGARYRVSLHGSNTGFARIKGRTLNTQDPECNGIVERHSVSLSIVEPKPNGNERQISFGRVKKHGEDSDRFNRRLKLRGFRPGQESRKLVVRQGVSTVVEGDMVIHEASVEHSKRLKQTR